MKYIALVLSLFCVLGSSSCIDDDDPMVVVDLTITLTIENPEGEDLLNPATLNAINEEDISVFYEINGVRKTYAEAMADNGTVLDNQKGFTLYPPSGTETRYSLNVYSNFTEGKPLTIVKIEGREEVSILTEVSKSNGNTLIQEIWYKDNSVWTINSPGPKYVQVVLD